MPAIHFIHYLEIIYLEYAVFFLFSGFAEVNLSELNLFRWHPLSLEQGGSHWNNTCKCLCISDFLWDFQNKLGTIPKARVQDIHISFWIYFCKSKPSFKRVNHLFPWQLTQSAWCQVKQKETVRIKKIVKNSQ